MRLEFKTSGQKWHQDWASREQLEHSRGSVLPVSHSRYGWSVCCRALFSCSFLQKSPRRDCKNTGFTTVITLGVSRKTALWRSQNKKTPQGNKPAGLERSGVF